MSTRSLTKADFATVTSSEGIVLVDFWAPWCRPCLQFAPTYEATSEQHPDIVFAKVDTDVEVELAREFDIQSIPTIMAIRDGVLVYRSSGSMPQAALASLISQVRDLNMAEINAKAG